jgi:hypothetical protein
MILLPFEWSLAHVQVCALLQALSYSTSTNQSSMHHPSISYLHIATSREPSPLQTLHACVEKRTNYKKGSLVHTLCTNAIVERHPFISYPPPASAFSPLSSMVSGTRNADGLVSHRVSCTLVACADNRPRGWETGRFLCSLLGLRNSIDDTTSSTDGDSRHALGRDGCVKENKTADSDGNLVERSNHRIGSPRSDTNTPSGSV